MVVLATALYGKTGTPLVSRHFVDLLPTALVEAFPMLVGTATRSEATFIETPHVRYIFHELKGIYVVVITTRHSNIIVDLESLHLFTLVVAECCRSLEENEILEKAFELIDAFDEVVSLGYREHVSLAQIRTFTLMDSNEERVFMQLKSAQEAAAKEKMYAHAKEFKKQQKEAYSERLGKRAISSLSSATSISSSSVPLTASASASYAPSASHARPSGGGKALKLGGTKAGKDDDSFIRQLRSEGQAVTPVAGGARGAAAAREADASLKRETREPVQVRTEEKLVAEVPRDGGLKSAEVFGTVSVSVAAPDYNTVALQMRNNADAAEGMGVMITVEEAQKMDGSEVVSHSAITNFVVDKYVIV